MGVNQNEIVSTGVCKWFENKKTIGSKSWKFFCDGQL